MSITLSDSPVHPGIMAQVKSVNVWARCPASYLKQMENLSPILPGIPSGVKNPPRLFANIALKSLS
ncbi:hypothetical protein D3C81_2206430 [compost metagenome]